MSDCESSCIEEPPGKKLKQTTLRFVMDQTVSKSPSTSSLREDDLSPGGDDPGAAETCTSDCCVERGLIPHQPKDPGVLLKLRRRHGERYRHFSPGWYSTYPWLTVCISRGKAFCVYCQFCTNKGLLSLAKKGEDAFVNTGFDNWKKALERLSKHAESDIHKEAVLKIELTRQKSISAQLNSQALTDQKVR